MWCYMKVWYGVILGRLFEDERCYGLGIFFCKKVICRVIKDKGKGS